MPTIATRAAILIGLVSLCGAGHETLGKDTSFANVTRGRYLVTAGDCIACHTADHGKPFAGGRPIETPFGTIYSPNITPDRETGIGTWSGDDFYRALHTGVGPDGTRLYPAFPYPYFTKMPRDDVLAMWAYLGTLEPVHEPRRPVDLAWPLNHRFLMHGWNWIFFDEGTYEPDPEKSAEWNRGAYLVQGPEHCGACHTPKNLAGGDSTSRTLEGGQIQNWFAPKLTDEERTGIGTWTVDELVEYLKTGRNSHSGATGLMAEVITHSTSRLTDADLHAIAVYVKSKEGSEPEPSDKPSQAVTDAGHAIFSDSCAACHQANGAGVPHMFPPLAKNANVQSKNPTSVIRVILEGARTVATDERPTPSTMPAFDWKLTDEEVAAVASYVRNAWGNVAPAVAAGDVRALRRELHARMN